MSEIQPLRLTIKSSILDRERQLTIAPGYIEFEDNDLLSKLPAKFAKEDIKAFRHGINWINGYYFTIGRVYCIDIQDKKNNIIKLRLKSVYGIRRKQLTDKYANILNSLYGHFFDSIAREYLSMFANKKDFELEGLLFSQSGIQLNKKSDLILWENVGTASYRTYYTIYAKSDENNYRAFEYLHHWNTGIVYSVSREILKIKGFYQEQQ